MIKYSSFVLGVLLAFSGCGGGGGSSTSGDSSSGGSSSLGVVINEVLADNNSTNVDPDLGLYSDWIELKNLNSTTVNLSGYGLSDSAKKVKWKFPDGTEIGANGLLLVWADDFNVTAHPNPTALHATFKLKSNDDKVVLHDPKGEIIASLDLKDYKITKPDVSIARNANGDYILSTTPTPGSENNSDAVTVSKTPDFSLKEGVYKSNPLNITITAENGATVCYTTDGAKPAETTSGTTTCQTAPVTVSLTQNKTTLKAIAKEPGNNKLVSKEKSKTYVIVPENERDVIINEIFSDNNKSATNQYKKYDWVELYNTTNADISLTNYKLSDKKKLSADNPVKALTGTIAANSYKVFTIDKTVDGFALSDSGDSAVLYKGTIIIDFKDFGKLKGVSLSRQGGAWDNNFTKTTTQTPGAQNAQQ
jgi:hypothetical protein